MLSKNVNENSYVKISAHTVLCEYQVMMVPVLIITKLVSYVIPNSNKFHFILYTFSTGDWSHEGDSSSLGKTEAEEGSKRKK